VSPPIVFVVGAGGELGRSTSAKLARDGYTVVGIDRAKDALDRLPDGVRREVADATVPSDVSPLIDRLVRDVGTPDALINTIGTFTLGDAASTTPTQLQAMMDVNLGPAVWLSQAVAPHMQRKGSGAIVHVSARPGLEPTAGMAAYGASKAALVQLVRILDLELRPAGIRVNSVAPEVLGTPTNRATFPEDLLAFAVPPDAIAEIIGFLISDVAAPISGVVLPAYGH
jgi:NAD(P)-dependent dehydrogenase (short-subunit alcohol dehydrogenase family)